jgi:hypothetical protein
VLKDISAKSPLAEAIKYTLGHWDGLTVFLTDGRVEVDSNTVEPTICRPDAPQHTAADLADVVRGLMTRPRSTKLMTRGTAARSLDRE